MIGKHLISYLESINDYKVIALSHKDCNLTCLKSTSYMFSNILPDFLINLAGFNGNIDFSKKYPADIFYKTSQIALNSLYAAQQYGVKKIVNIISSCAIADIGDKQLKENELWAGLPNSSIEAHGLAKRVWDAYSRQLYKQYGTIAVSAIVNNSFGEFDNTDINKTKAVMGIIKRVVNAQRENLPFIECWGSGEVYREFIYAGDVAKGLVEVLKKYDNPMEPINISSKDEISIKELTYKIASIVGYKGEIRWDISKPDGQKRKSLNTDKMSNMLNMNFTPIDTALLKTIEWYKGIKDA